MNRRAQLVVLAGAVVAVALIPVLVAALQLGGGPLPGSADPGIASVERVLETAVGDGATTTLAYAWTERANASAAFHASLAKPVAGLETGATPGFRTITYDEATAESVARTACPTGPNRRFGECVAIDGVVLQDRGGITHVVAVALRVTVVSAEDRTSVTLVVRPPVGVRDRVAPHRVDG